MDGYDDGMGENMYIMCRLSLFFNEMLQFLDDNRQARIKLLVRVAENFPSILRSIWKE